MEKVIYVRPEEDHRVKINYLIGALTMGRYQVINPETGKWETKIRMFFVKDIRIPVEDAVIRAYEQRFVNPPKPIMRLNLASGQPTPIRRG